MVSLKKCFKLKSAILCAIVFTAMSGMFFSCTEDDPEKTDENTPPSTVDAVFSVSAKGKVRFSPGNLQYQASTNTWRFAEHQYDFVGDSANGTVYENGVKCDNALVDSGYTGWIDLFCWGTSGYNGKHPYLASPVYDYTCEIKDITGTNYDWGVYNNIYNPKTNATDSAGTWRTLTQDEWVYLLTRRGAVFHPDWWLYSVVTIKRVDGTNDVSGLIIYPNGISAKPAGVNAALTQNNKTSVDITKGDYEKLEAAGCVFLPAASRRHGTAVTNEWNSGYYWNSMYWSFWWACNLSFKSGKVDPNGRDDVGTGLSVRLVR